ncbi:MAG: diacylglycerol kinase family protein [Burkholderiaceae bacterium]
MTPALFIVFNIGSGHGNAAAVRATIESACAEAGREMHLIVVEEPQRITELAAEAVRRAGQVGGVVVAAGGDGTINAVAQATFGSGCTFGVLPQGTFNYFSRTHGIPDEIAPAMQVLLHETAQPVQVGLVNDRVFLVNASLGLYPKLLEDREAWKKRLGRSRLVAIGAGLMTLLRGYRNLRLVIGVHGETREVRTPTLFVGNNALQMEQFGFPEAQAIDAGELAGVTLRPVARLAMLGLLLRGALGRLGEADQVLDFSFRQLTVVSSQSFGKRRVNVATDGEITRMSLPLVFRVSPKPLWLIRPTAPAPERGGP